MDQFKISAKNLGQIALDTFCPRCFWIKLKVNNKLPWQIFPGIFSTIDAYTKKCAHEWIDRSLQVNPPIIPTFLADYKVSGYQKSPHWSKFRTATKHLITLTGVTDDIWTVPGGIVIADWKTAKFTENADKLLPMYKVQLNGYAKIADSIGMGPVVGIVLVYMEPQTEEKYVLKNTKADHFDMAFLPKVLPLDLDIESIDPLLERARELYDGCIPERGQNCKDCMALDEIGLIVNQSEDADPSLS